ncbi:TniQ family protein [Aquicoccus porphyridii]|uniref:TniQ family protein n=1 Tax=Rhodobacterales TaxID=204455 RepID=UPI001373152B|nr:TniQ family protein [Aquicoccus porphyridii]
MNRKPLPRRPAPFQDELLSSWITRLADANYCSVPELCRYLGLAQERPPETLTDLIGVDTDRFCATLRLPPEELDSMLIQRRAEFPIECISWSNFQHCSVCAHKVPRISLRHWRFAWSMHCEACGSELLPVRSKTAAHVHLPTRLRIRAKEGAKRLMLAYRHGNCHAGRRMDLTLQVAGVLAPEIRHGSLFSQNRIDRFKIVAAIDLGMTRPLLATALVLKNDPASETRLRAAFPHKRKLLDRLARLAESLPQHRSREGASLKNHSWMNCAGTAPTPEPEYLEAARRAIDQLGKNAERSDLLNCAAEFLENAR